MTVRLSGVRDVPCVLLGKLSRFAMDGLKVNIFKYSY